MQFSTTMAAMALTTMGSPANAVHSAQQARPREAAAQGTASPAPAPRRTMQHLRSQPNDSQGHTHHGQAERDERVVHGVHGRHVETLAKRGMPPPLLQPQAASKGTGPEPGPCNYRMGMHCKACVQVFFCPSRNLQQVLQLPSTQPPIQKTVGHSPCGTRQTKLPPLCLLTLQPLPCSARPARGARQLRKLACNMADASHLREQFAEASAASAKHQRRASVLESEVSLLQAQLQSNAQGAAAYRRLQERVDGEVQVVEQLKGRMAALQGEVQALKAKNSTLTRQLTDLQSGDQQRSAAADAAAQKLALAAHEVTQLRQERQESQAKTQELTRTVSTLQASLTELRAALAAEQEAHAATQQASASHKAAADAGRQDLATQLREASAEVKDLRRAVAAAESRRAEAEGEAEAARQGASASASSTSELSAQVTRLTRERDAAQQQLSEARASARRLQSANTTLQEYADSVAAELATVKATVQTLADSTVPAAAAASVQEQLAVAEAELHSTRSALALLRTQHQATQQELEHTRVAADASRQREAAAAAALAQTQEQLLERSALAEDALSESATLRASSGALDATVTSLEAEAAAARADVKASGSALEGMRRRVADLEDRLAAADLQTFRAVRTAALEDVQGFRRAVYEAQAAWEAARERVQEAEAEVQDMRAGCQRLQGENAELRRRSTAQADTIARLEGELQVYQRVDVYSSTLAKSLSAIRAGKAAQR